MIKIHFTPVWCTLEHSLVELDAFLYEKLAFQETGFFFSQAFQNRGWDGVTRLYYLKTKRFRSGLLERVKQLLAENNYAYEVCGFPEGVLNPCLNLITVPLRPYQESCVTTLLDKRFGILKAPPRSGKTNIAAAVIAAEEQFPVLFFCRSLDLAKQTIQRFQDLLPNRQIGLVGDGIFKLREITVMTVQSVYSAFDKKYDVPKAQLEKGIADIWQKHAIRTLLASAKRVIYDEVHHGKGATSKFVLDKCTHLTMKVGLSATPFNDSEEGMLLEQVFGKIIHEVSYSELIKAGYLLRPVIYMYKLPKLKLEGTYPSIYKQGVTENEYLNNLIKKIVDKLISLGNTIVVQTEYINHSINLGKILNCPVLTGQERDTEVRAKIIQDLRDKKISCLVSTLFEEGLDVPSLSFTINAAGGLSNISTLQRMRSITADAGKATCGIIDFYHQCKYLSRHSKIRETLYTSEPEFVLHMRDISKKKLEEVV